MEDAALVSVVVFLSCLLPSELLIILGLFELCEPGSARARAI